MADREHEERQRSDERDEPDERARRSPLAGDMSPLAEEGGGLGGDRRGAPLTPTSVEDTGASGISARDVGTMGAGTTGPATSSPTELELSERGVDPTRVGGAGMELADLASGSDIVARTGPIAGAREGAGGKEGATGAAGSGTVAGRHAADIGAMAAASEYGGRPGDSPAPPRDRPPDEDRARDPDTTPTREPTVDPGSRLEDPLV